MTEPAAGGPSGGPRLVVAVLTYRRPDDLAAVLPMLVEHVASLDVPAHVLVVDNDPDAGACHVVTSRTDDVVRYVHEPRPGIAAARNRALEESAEEDLLVFVDDDERPQGDWLRLLLDVWRDGRPAAVVGPVVSVYEREPEEWIRAGRFFDRRRLPTGTEVDVAATNNLLLDMTQVRSAGLRFDERFGLTGGSDTLFTRALAAAGGRMVWCDEAVVLDAVPASRLTRRWVLQRALRSGNSWTRTSLVLAGTPAARARVRVVCAGRGVLRVLGGSGRWAVGVVTRSTGQRARGARTVARGAGLLSGTWGSVYSEYRRA